MSFFGSIISAATKVVIFPVAIVTDVVKVSAGHEPDSAVIVLESVIEDIDQAFGSL